jgi:hypothetical protein
MKGKLMVLGPIHLQTLRKLKEQAPIKTGLHISVSSLVKSGFVEHTPEGYFISETGHLALIAYGEMDDLHREIIMRLNRAAVENQRYSKYALKSVAEQDCFSDLLLWDLVDVDEHDGITLTEAGHKLWKIAQTAHAHRDDTKGGFDAANEKQRQKKREREAVTVAVDAATGEIIEPDTVVVKAVVTPPITEAPSPGDCPDCSGCIDAEVLALLAEKYPKVKELRQALLQQKQILKELGL